MLPYMRVCVCGKGCTWVRRCSPAVSCHNMHLQPSDFGLTCCWPSCQSLHGRACREFPGELEKIRVWFRDYKTPDGKPQNKFGFNDQPQNKEFTLKIIAETHEFYNKLKSGARQNTEELALA